MSLMNSGLSANLPQVVSRRREAAAERRSVSDGSTGKIGLMRRSGGHDGGRVSELLSVSIGTLLSGRTAGRGCTMTEFR